jgi:hypothetical protein
MKIEKIKHYNFFKQLLAFSLMADERYWRVGINWWDYGINSKGFFYKRNAEALKVSLEHFSCIFMTVPDMRALRRAKDLHLIFNYVEGIFQRYGPASAEFSGQKTTQEAKDNLGTSKSFLYNADFVLCGLRRDTAFSKTHFGTHSFSGNHLSTSLSLGTSL